MNRIQRNCDHPYPAPEPPKFRPGDHVEVRPNPYSDTWKAGVICYEPPSIMGLCILQQHDTPCYEWANVLLEEGSWRTHVSECQMRLSEFGRALRGEEAP